MPNILQFKILLVESNPLIWRRFRVTDDYRMDRFHQVLQIVMGWMNSHLHEFRIKDRNVGMLMDTFFDDFPKVEDETTLYLREMKLQASDSFAYIYDFGDNWLHVLEVEKIYSGELEHPECLEGQQACPPEDCGGIWGYEDLLEILKDQSHPEYEEYEEWLPEGFKPDYFPLDAINKELKAFGEWHRKHPRKKSTPWHQI